MSWLIDRAFCITPSIKQNTNILKIIQIKINHY